MRRQTTTAPLTSRWLRIAILAAAFATPSTAQDESVVAVAPAERGHLDRVVKQAANLVAYEQVLVFSRATGYAQEVLVDIGDDVKKGQPLAFLDVPEQEATLAAAEAELIGTQAEVERAGADAKLKEALYELTKNLFDKQARSKFHLEEADANRELSRAMSKVAAAREKQARAKRERAKTLAGYGKVVAPFAGVVTQRLVDPGALVLAGSASGAMPLFEVQRVDKLRCRIDVPERDAILVIDSQKHGALSASVAFAGLSLEWTNAELGSANVRFSKALHSKSKHMLAEILVDNSQGRLLPGFFGRAILKVETGKRLLLVPNTGIQSPRKGVPHVFVVRNYPGSPTVERVNVQLGITDGRRTEIRQPALPPGTLVVVRGAANLLDGQAVRVPAGSGS
jgi:RND family efflux transporter MFP subunit